MKKRITVALIFTALGSVAFAGRVAHWWEWKSSTGAIVCAQTTPGKGWVKWTGPYSDLKWSMKENKYRVSRERSTSRPMTQEP